MLTNGYDYIFALSWSAINTMLTNNLQGKTIEINCTIAETGLTGSLDVFLGPWQIVDGGGNLEVYLNLPITSGSLTLDAGSQGPAAAYDLTNISVIISVHLGWLGTGDQQQAIGSGDASQLVFIPTDTPNSPGGVSLVNILDVDKKLDSLGQAALRESFVGALVSNQAKLQYIFANLNPTPSNLATWLTPKIWQYFNVYSTTAPCALAFLCQLSANTPLPASTTFDANSLDPSSNTLLMIAQKALFDNVLLPAVQQSFPSGSFSSSVNSNEQAMITNNGDFSAGRTTATSYALTTNVSGDGLMIGIKGGGPMKFLFGLADLPGASYSWSLDTNNPFQYTTPTITFQQDPNPNFQHDQTVHWYDWALLATVGIGGLDTLVSAIEDMVDGIYNASEAIGVGKINDSIQQAIGNSVVNLSNLVQWPQSTETFTPATAGLSTALYVRGTIE